MTALAETATALYAANSSITAILDLLDVKHAWLDAQTAGQVCVVRRVFRLSHHISCAPIISLKLMQRHVRLAISPFFSASLLLIVFEAPTHRVPSRSLYMYFLGRLDWHTYSTSRISSHTADPPTPPRPLHAGHASSPESGSILALAIEDPATPVGRCAKTLSACQAGWWQVEPQVFSLDSRHQSLPTDLFQVSIARSWLLLNASLRWQTTDLDSVTSPDANATAENFLLQVLRGGS